MMKKLAWLAAAAALTAAPVFAQSLPARAPLSGDESQAGGGANIIAAALLAGIGAIAIIAATDGDDRPVSA